MHVAVVVLGDLGRSPRMQYHTQSLLEAGHAVTFIGYTGEDLIPALTHKKHAAKLRVIRFTAPKVKILKTHALLFYYAWRMASLTALLGYALFVQLGVGVRVKVNLMLVQNPPAIPALMLAWLYCRLSDAKLVIDWHNLAYSMISLGGPLRKFAHWYEMTVFGPLADGHLAVTDALRDYLVNQGIVRAALGTDDATTPISVLHDSPPAQFRMRTVAEQHAILSSLNDELVAACPTDWKVAGLVGNDRQTLFTESVAPAGARRPTVQPRAGRPALVVSSTSWTPDEDIGILLDAWQEFDRQVSESNTNVKVVCVLTGKGPLKSHYQARIAQLTLQHVVIVTLWVRIRIVSYLFALGCDWLTCGSRRPCCLVWSSCLHVPAGASQTPLTSYKTTGIVILSSPVCLCHFVPRYTSAHKRNNQCRMPFLFQLQIEPKDYPTYLACADLGVSLHTSTSGRDLPIKILDYFGCEVPVAAYDFACLHELVQDDVNGRTFTTSSQLAQILWQLLSPLAKGANAKRGVGNHDFGDLQRYSLQIQGRALWSESWPKHAKPLIEGLMASTSSTATATEEKASKKDD